MVNQSPALCLLFGQGKLGLYDSFEGGCYALLGRLAHLHTPPTPYPALEVLLCHPPGPYYYKGGRDITPPLQFYGDTTLPCPEMHRGSLEESEKGQPAFYSRLLSQIPYRNNGPTKSPPRPQQMPDDPHLLYRRQNRFSIEISLYISEFSELRMNKCGRLVHVPYYS